MYHTTVLLKEAVEALAVKPDGIYVDATFGGGGHSALILEKLGAHGKLLGFDQDDAAEKNVPSDARFTFINHNFRELKHLLRFEGIKQVDGILADLGVSSFQFDTAERGFSYRFDADLDMRMNTSDKRTAADVLNKTDAVGLQTIFGEYGEVRNSRTLANAIVAARIHKPYRRISDALAVIEPQIIGPKMRYLSQVFQALRIEVNDEMGALKLLLQQSLDILKPNGILSVITFHSLEDRIVKNFMKTGNSDGILQQDFFGNTSKYFNVITKKPIEPSDAEIKANVRSRSAKLRVAQKI